MSMPDKSRFLRFDGASIQIAQEGAVLSLDYSGARNSHGGDSWWGVAVAYRAMQVAADMLSTAELWDRDELSVVSGHPGPGVRDAIDYVTRCVARNRYSLFEEMTGATNCRRGMTYEWWLCNGKMAVAVSLQVDFIPAQFYDLLDRMGSDQEQSHDRDQFGVLKADLEARIWQEPLAVNFRAEEIPVFPINERSVSE